MSKWSPSFRLLILRPCFPDSRWFRPEDQRRICSFFFCPEGTKVFEAVCSSILPQMLPVIFIFEAHVHLCFFRLPSDREI